jgi:TolB-like protein
MSTIRQVIGRYTVLSELGQGAMGVVYAARDEELERRIAIKMIRDPAAGSEARERLRREARALASVNHPNICQVYEVGEHSGELFLTMELLEGEPLAASIGRGPLPLAQGLDTELGILSALEALHRRDIVHRDLKPTNVFLTPHGVKLLDFGLARPLALPAGDGLELTAPGTLVGSPRYMAPEQWAGEVATPAADLFAAGALLFEMLAGKPAFPGTTLLEIARAVGADQPPPLAGGPAVMAADRVIQRALMKRPADRYPNAAAMAQDIRGALELVDLRDARVVATTRLIVLPFRLLRPDPEIDFLASSLPDAITASLAGCESLVVRSSLAAAGGLAAGADLRQLMAAADVDIALTGTLLRSGDQVRVAAQLAESPAGTMVWSVNIQASMQEIFELQDELARRIVDSLSAPLATRGHVALQRDVPASPRAYELFLRANHLGVNTTSRSLLLAARDLYRQCVAEDPNYAPGWAQLARLYRVHAKYFGENLVEDRQLASEAFARAFALNPRLPLAHNLYTYFEVEELGRPAAAIARLLNETRLRPNDPQLFAGLVVACRFAGLLDASLEADRRARRLDPKVATSVPYTHFLRGNYERAWMQESPFSELSAYAHANYGRNEEAKAELDKVLASQLEGAEKLFVRSLYAVIEGDVVTTAEISRSPEVRGFSDSEGIYYFARNAAHVGLAAEAIELLTLCVDRGFTCHEAFARDPWLDSLRANPEFVQILRRAEAGAQAAARVFREAGGEQLLGVSAL